MESAGLARHLLAWQLSGDQFARVRRIATDDHPYLRVPMPSNILITGISSGIGLGLGSHFLKTGHRVFGVSRRTPPDAIIASENLAFQTLDLRDQQSVQTRLAKLLDGIGELELVILNAGILGPIADLRDTPLAELQAIMNTNVWANKTVIDTLVGLSIGIRQVVTISSGAAVNGNRGWGGYSISKAALNMLTKLYAKENPAIHFAAVAPGLVDTAMQDQLCAMTDKTRQFPSLAALQSKRGGPEMPDPIALGPRLAQFLTSLPTRIESGEFIDIRHD